MSDKNEVCRKLSELVIKIPFSVRNGSIQLVRQWKEDRDKAEKILEKSRSSLNDLESMVNLMEKYK